MKSKLLLMWAAVTILFCLFACSPQLPVSVCCDDFTANQHISKEVEVTVGDSFTVTLCSNPSTGFQWSESAKISDQTVLQQIAHEFIRPKDLPERPPPAGSPSKEVWTFKTLKKGTSTISSEYSRPWEGGEKGEWACTVNVVK